MKSKFFLSIFFAGLMFLYTFAPADAALYSFEIIDSDSGNATIGEAQFFVDVTNAGVNTDTGANQVLFDFTNTGPIDSSITEVYFDDGSLLGIAQLDNRDPGVSFSQVVHPSNLPEGKNAVPPFEATEGFYADSKQPINGVNPGEYFGIIFNLQFDPQDQEKQDYYDVLDELSDGTLRIGLHARFPDIATPPSNSFINNPNPVPIPASVWMFGAGLIGLIGIRRKLAS